MILSNVFKFVVGVLLALALLAAGSFGAAVYFFNKLTKPPQKPIFANERPQQSAKSSPPAASKPAPASSPKASPSPAPSPEPKRPEDPPGAYRARVSWPQGLILRDQPGVSANQLGGIAFDQDVVVLQESPDKKWQQVRVVDTEQQGWIKAGNVARAEAQQDQ